MSARPMSKRKAKREACKVVADLIQNYFDVGQPHHDCENVHNDWKPEDVAPLVNAFTALEDEMLRRSGR